MAIVDDAGAVPEQLHLRCLREPTVTGSLANEFDFAGQQTDEDTGLQYLRARYMDPETGVFLSRDPLAVAPGWPGNPSAYTDANPTTLTDPRGLWPDWNPIEAFCPPWRWIPCEETQDVEEAAESLTDALRRAGYIDVNATVPIGFAVVITAGCQVASDDPLDVHCYLGGGLGTIGLSINFGPGQTIVDGWSCGTSVSGGAPISVGGQAGAAGIDLNEYGEEAAEQFYEYGIGTPGLGGSVTCYYVGSVGAWGEIISGIVP